jgi:two-component system, cell cycle sensor histidine kinase and response regulator CckA
MRILAIDDNQESLYLLEWLLKQHNHEVITAKNGKEALREVGTHEIDLIVSDVLMPVMDGFTLCKILKADKRYKDIPFIVYTATYTGPQDEVLAMQIGADKFVVKPCDPEELIQIIEDVKDSRNRGDANSIDVSARSEDDVLELYNQRLVRKLEQKMLQTEQEIEARKEIEKKLLRSQALLKISQKIGKIGSWEWDVENDKMYWTEETFKIHDFDNELSLEGTKGKIEKSINCYSIKDQVLIREKFARCLKTGEPYDIECDFTTAKGRKLKIRTAGQACIENGEITKIQGYIQDITDYDKALVERNKLKDQLFQTQKLDSIGRLAAGIAHDFNNVMNIVLGYNDYMLRSLKPEDRYYNEAVEISKAGQRAVSLIRQLLTFCRKTPVNTQLVDLNKLIREFQKMLLRIIGSNIKLITNLSEESTFVDADISQIEQVVLNLVINAKDAMPNGGELRIETGKYIVDKKEDEFFYGVKSGKYVLLSVSDQGIGMEKEILSKIFEPFFSTKASDKGTGLGLSTVYGIVKQAGGDIKVTSIPNEGTTFKLLFPEAEEQLSICNIEQDEQKNSKQSSRDNSMVQKSVQTNVAKELNVLMIDDDSSYILLVERYFLARGHTFIGAVSKEHALNILSDNKFDVLLVDMNMPGSDGLEVLRKIRESGIKTPAIILSGILVRVNNEVQRELDIRAVRIKDSNAPYIVDVVESVCKK